MGPSSALQRIEESLHRPTDEEKLRALIEEHAALTIQRAWKKHQQARFLGPDFLWSDMTTHAQFKVDRDAAHRGDNSPRQRWRRAAFLIGRLGDGNAMLSHSGQAEHAKGADRKHLETQHWLELIDGKHRYGSNLKVNIRDSFASTLNSLLLYCQWYHRRWQDDNTTENFFRWLDEGGGKDLSLKECPREQLEKERITYLSSKQLNVFIGIKDPGTFQHSSFLGGGLVTSAGLISVKDGLIHTLSPLSGHYRTSISHFKQFLSVLEERGVDMHKVEISKAEAALWGIEHLKKFQKKQAELVKSGKEGVEDAAHKVVKKVHTSDNGNAS
ncbi:hypothetical protein EUX98_g664 [Antrodiella citrinella]|uniref:Uncharacterized protein n=1 Tax=Antrodiella citrinella TaxID=2447956 RepID=A0A4V3XJM0_9APHY|nr:hypothetical protein EUX98_g664 [Antrodiella citrinella]